MKDVRSILIEFVKRNSNDDLYYIADHIEGNYAGDLARIFAIFCKDARMDNLFCTSKSADELFEWMDILQEVVRNEMKRRNLSLAYA